jgi:hypothetical protein
LSEGVNTLNIEDLARANQERDINTARLQDLNTFNFGQENTGAEFDLNQWKAEESAKEARTGQGLEYASMYRDPYSVGMGTMGAGLSNWGSDMTSMGMNKQQNQQSVVQNTPSMPASSYNWSNYGQGLAPTQNSVSGAWNQLNVNRNRNLR